MIFHSTVGRIEVEACCLLLLCWLAGCTADHSPSYFTIYDLSGVPISDELKSALESCEHDLKNEPSRPDLVDEPDRPAGDTVKKKKSSRQQLEKRCAEIDEELEAARDKLLRLQAEFENYKKRQVREREIYRKSANEDLLRAMLPVLDNLERAVEHGEESSDVVQLLEGVHLVLKQMRESFLQAGVKPVDALKASFDPHEHEAMSTVDTDGDPPDGTVVEVYQKGYLLHGRVLRPALVAVAKMVDERGEEEEG